MYLMCIGYDVLDKTCLISIECKCTRSVLTSGFKSIGRWPPYEENVTQKRLQFCMVSEIALVIYQGYFNLMISMY